MQKKYDLAGPEAGHLAHSLSHDVAACLAAWLAFAQRAHAALLTLRHAMSAALLTAPVHVFEIH